MERKLNRLSKEKSPYLLQHQYNPVNWFPWSKEAFIKAKTEDKPVFLSIGYSTCHWCHVMERESFEDEKVADLLNKNFISIKVDREERPDIDSLYMNVCHMLTGSGGWPLTIVMTPDAKPFFAGTYFPKENRFGRSGLLELLPRLNNIWLNRREDIIQSSENIYKALKDAAEISQNEEINKNIFEKTYKEFKSRFDPVYGGFNTSPKFPTPHNFFFLLRYWKRYKQKDALDMVEKTLVEMRKGGIFDHIGFGFHRYSTDPQWLLPHFEKMLYDQALLCMAYTETYLATKKNFYKKTAEEILTYVLRDMNSPEGGFYSAEDADSEGIEGKFYLWNMNEIKILLKDKADLFIKVFNFTPEGNMITGVVNQGHEQSDGSNIPYLEKTLNESADELNMPLEKLESDIDECRAILFNLRERRIHPLKDDKILTDWNGIMISAFAKAAQAFNNKTYEKAAEKAAQFIMKKLLNKDGRLFHRFRNGESALKGNIDDYAFFIAGLLDLYETTFNPDYLKTAIKLNDIMIKHFWDEEKGGFFFTPDDAEELIVRQKEIYDGAVPSGNSVQVLNLLRLSGYTASTDYREKAYKTVQNFSKSIKHAPSGFSQLLTGLDFGLNGSLEIVIAGEKESYETEKFIHLIRSEFLPDKVVIFKSESNKDEIEKIASYTKEQNMINGKTAVFVCENFKCNLPVTDPDKLKENLH